MHRRNLSGYFYFHKFEEEEKKEPTVFEDCPIEQQKKILEGLCEEAKDEFILGLAKVIRTIGDEFDLKV